jgi:hypothetical protein
MDVAFTYETSIELQSKPFSHISGDDTSIVRIFADRQYGEDLKSLIISIVCMAPRFEPFFKPRKPRYRTEEKTFVDHGIQVTSPARYLGYDLRLDFETYLNSKEPKALFARDVLASLDTISTIKKIKDFDLPRFKADFELFFKENGWL